MEALGALRGLFLLGLAILAAVLGMLAILTPLFVYQIRESAKAAVVELQILNANIGRFLAAEPRPNAPTAPLTARPTLPVGATVEEKAKFYGTSTKK